MFTLPTEVKARDGFAAQILKIDVEEPLYLRYPELARQPTDPRVAIVIVS